MKCGEGILIELLKPGVWNSDLYNQDWKSLEDLEIILITTTRIMYENKTLAWILYMHNLKIYLLKRKHLKFDIEGNLISIIHYGVLFKLKSFRIFWREKKSSCKKVINTGMASVVQWLSFVSCTKRSPVGSIPSQVICPSCLINPQ